MTEINDKIYYSRSAMIESHCQPVGLTFIKQNIMFAVVMVHKVVHYREVHEIIKISVYIIRLDCVLYFLAVCPVVETTFLPSVEKDLG